MSMLTVSSVCVCVCVCVCVHLRVCCECVCFGWGVHVWGGGAVGQCFRGWGVTSEGQVLIHHRERDSTTGWEGRARGRSEQPRDDTMKGWSEGRLRSPCSLSLSPSPPPSPFHTLSLLHCLTSPYQQLDHRGQPLPNEVICLGWSRPLTRFAWSLAHILTNWTLNLPSLWARLHAWVCVWMYELAWLYNNNWH